MFAHMTSSKKSIFLISHTIDFMFFFKCVFVVPYRLLLQAVPWPWCCLLQWEPGRYNILHQSVAQMKSSTLRSRTQTLGYHPVSAGWETEDPAECRSGKYCWVIWAGPWPQRLVTFILFLSFLLTCIFPMCMWDIHGCPLQCVHVFQIITLSQMKCWLI